MDIYELKEIFPFSFEIFSSGENLEFFKALDRKILMKEFEYKDTWKKMWLADLYERLQECYRELMDVKNDIIIGSEIDCIVDVANLCRLLFMRIKMLEVGVE